MGKYELILYIERREASESKSSKKRDIDGD